MLQNQIADYILNQEDRRKFLSNNADRREKVSYFKRLQPEEQTALKDELSDVSIDLDKAEEAKKAVTAEYNEEIKGYKKRRSKILTVIREKGEQVSEDCYVMLDHESNQVGFYNEHGHLVDQRPMKPQERQQTIFTAVTRNQATGTDS